MPSHLEVILSLSDSVFLGQKVATLESAPALDPVSKVILLVDDENYFEAGTDGGRVLEVTCPYATQQMANDLLATLSGYSYQPAQAGDALLDPAAEIGDALTVDGIYTMIAQMDLTFDALMTSDVGAPGEEEIESEYPYQSQQTTESNRKLADTRSLITKTADQIQLTVENELQKLSAQITVQLDSITSQVNGLDGQVSSIEQYVDSITLSVSNGSTSSTIQLKAGSTTISSQTITMDGLVTFIGLANGTTTINGGCIKTGTIDADRLNLTGAITFGDLSYTMQNEINDISSTAYSAASEAGQAHNLAEAVDNTVSGWVYPGSTMIDGSSIMTGTVTASTLRGGQVQLLNAQGSSSGHITIGSATSGAYAIELHSDAAMRIECDSGLLYLNGGPNVTVYCDTFFPSGPAPDLGSTSLGMWQEVFSYTAEINTSDANWKHDVEEVPEKYLDMLGDIVPVRYKMNNGQSNRYHIGFIAQNVKSAMDAHGVSDTDFAGWCQDVDGEGNEIQLLRYAEFIALLWAKIRNLEAKING